MNLTQFLNWALNAGTLGKYLDGSFPGECVSLINQYLARVFGIMAGAWGNAKDWPTNSNVLQFFDRVASPQAGDIGVMGPNYGGGYGHIFIYLTPTTILEQNGAVAHRITTGGAYANPIAILRRKGTQLGGSMSPEQAAKIRQDQLRDIGKEVSVYNGDEHVDVIINNIRTLQSWFAQRDVIQKQIDDLIQLAEDRRKELEAKGADTSDTKALQDHLNELQSRLDQINELSKKEI